MSENGLHPYDLEPPGSSGIVPQFRSLADIRRTGPRLRYVPPPVPDGHVRVELDDDYYLGPGYDLWSREWASFPARVFDVPAEQYERWQKARADYAAMQEEISALRDGRLATNEWVPPGWTPKPAYQVQP